MTLTLSNDLLPLYASHEQNHTPQDASSVDNGTEVMSSSIAELSDDSSLTKDDLVVLSDLFGLANPPSSTQPKQVTSTQPHSRKKRPRSTKSASANGIALPKSQQQRQKLEIEFLRNQVVELQATIEDLRAQKFKRKRPKLQHGLNENCPALNAWVESAKSQVIAVQQLQEQNEKLLSQVAAHLGELKKIECIARTRCLANAVPGSMQLTGHPAANSYSSPC